MNGCTDTLTLPSETIGDLWFGYAFGPIVLESGETVDPLLRVKMVFTHTDGTVIQGDTDVVADFAVAITDAATWEFNVGSGDVLPFTKAGRWDFALKAYEAVGGPYTILRGSIHIKPA